MSMITMQAAGVRAVGTKDAQGMTHGGVYYPAHMKNGKAVSARWEGNVASNGNRYTDANGVRQEGKVTYLRIVVWNSKNATPGNGAADNFAKHVSVGKSLILSLTPESFEKRIFVNGQPLMDPQGNVITQNAVIFRVSGGFNFLESSANQIAAEIQRWNSGVHDVLSRPAGWNTPGTPDHNEWLNIIAQKKAYVYDGQSSVYGYARVIVPEGAQVMNTAMPQAPANPQTPVNPQTPAIPQVPVNPQVPVGTAPVAAAEQFTNPTAQTGFANTQPVAVI